MMKTPIEEILERFDNFYIQISWREGLVDFATWLEENLEYLVTKDLDQREKLIKSVKKEIS